MLYGAQRRGKSRGLRALVSPTIQGKVTGWFTDEEIDMESKDGTLLLQTAWLLEVGEMDSFKGRKHSTIKQFLSRQEDRIRVPYGRYIESRPRHCILAGTTNEKEYLSDTTGNLRYYGVGIDTVDVTWIEENREQIWAEVLQMYRAGKPWYFETLKEQVRLQEHNKRFEVRSPWFDVIENYLRRSGGKTRRVTVTQALERGLGFSAKEMRATHRQEVTGIFRALGLVEQTEKEYVEGEVGYFWRVPDNMFPAKANTAKYQQEPVLT